MIMNETIKWIGLIASVATLITVAINLYLWKREQKARKKEELRRKEHIAIQLSDGKRTITLPGVVPREQLTRREVMGRIGTIPKKQTLVGQEQKRFFLLYPNKAEFLDRIEELYYGAGRDRILSVECSEKEIDQFDKDKMDEIEFDLRGF